MFVIYNHAHTESQTAKLITIVASKYIWKAYSSFENKIEYTLLLKVTEYVFIRITYLPLGPFISGHPDIVQNSDMVP